MDRERLNPSYDLYQLDSGWSPEQRALTQAVRKYIKNTVIPLMPSCQNEGRFPLEIIPGLKELGLLKLISEDSLDPIAYGLALRELEWAGSGIRSFASVQGSLVMSSIRLFGSDEQKKTWLPALGDLDVIGCFGLTEPDFGSNPSGMRTTAEKTKTGYQISGQKCWITNGTLSKIAIIWAKLEGAVRGFVVETDRPGFEARSIEGKWSFRVSDTAELFLDKVEIPETALLPHSKSVGSALKCLNQARYGIAWGVIGAARACLETTIDYLLERPQFNGKPLASHQLIQNKIAWMATELTGMELIAKRLGELKTSGELQPHHVSLAKMNNCRKALEIARTCRELLGANGIHNEYPIGRHLLDLETVVTYEGTEHIHSLILAEKLTGIPSYA